MRTPAVPIDPIQGILDAFRNHSLVALAEGIHNNEQAHAFRLSLVRDPRFPAVVNDIVVEFGSARYQELMDRFVRDETFAEADLRKAWQDTTAANAVWDRPIYEEFFRAVREVNAPLPAERKLRVLLGDPPIDWDSVHSRQDLESWMKDMARERHPADLIRREVLDKRRHALVIYGDGHLQRKDVLINFEPSDPAVELLLMRLERSSGTKVFSIWTETSVDVKTLQSDVAAWRHPSLALLKGTVLGGADVSSYAPGPIPRFKNTRDGPDFSSPIPREGWARLPMEDQFDAVMYLGPPSDITLSQIPRALCKDAQYMTMRVGRMTVAGMQRQADQLKQYCVSLAR